MSARLLEIKDLETHFFTEEGVVRAVGGVSLSVDRGEVLGIVGESGSGKSVMSLSIMRLVADPPGRIVGGSMTLHTRETAIDLARATEREMQDVRGNRVAMIFQDPMTSLNPYLRISRQLTEVLEIHRGMRPAEARARSIDMLRSVGIPDPARRIDDYPHQLSGGMRQRVMIAMALLCEPDLLIADEPTTALDVTIQAQILELINERTGRRAAGGSAFRGDEKQPADEGGVGVILITHDLGVVARVADRIAVMYAGRIVETGDTVTIFREPRHPYTIGLARSIPRLEGERLRRLTPIPGMPPSLAKLPSGCPFRVRCPAAKPICSEAYPDERVVDGGTTPHVVRCHEEDVDKIQKGYEAAS
ncbi:MAG: ABC transporter ATP-binding protein [Polyangiaceae bacterium]